MHATLTSHCVMWQKFVQSSTCHFCHKLCNFHMPTLAGMWFFVMCRHVTWQTKFAPDLTATLFLIAAGQGSEIARKWMAGCCLACFVCQYTACHEHGMCYRLHSIISQFVAEFWFAARKKIAATNVFFAYICFSGSRNAFLAAMSAFLTANYFFLAAKKMFAGVFLCW